MNKYLLLFSFFFCSFSIKSQDWLLSTPILGSSIEPKYSTIDNQNNIYILSFFTDTIYYPYSVHSRGSRDLFIVKINPQGTVLWHRQIGSKGLEVVGGIATDNNYVYVTGIFYDNCRFSENDSLIASGSTGDIFLAKYDLNGILQWTKKISSSSTYESALDLKYTNNKLVFCGAFRDSLIIGSSLSDKDTLLTNGFTSNFIAEFDLDGIHKWSKRFHGTHNNTRIFKVAVSDDGYYFGGFFQGDLSLDIGTISSYTSTAFDAFLYKTDLNGNGEWVRRIRGQNTESFRSIATDEFNNVYILGNYNSPSIFVDSTESIIKTFIGNTGGYDTYISKYNRSGVLQWFVRKGSTAKDNYLDFVVRNNLIYATGFFTNEIIFNNDTLRTSSTNNSDAFLASFNQTGNPISGISITGTGNYEDAGTVVNMDASSRAYVSGYFRSPQIQIGDQVYTSNNINKSDLFFAIYQHPFKAAITAERMVPCNGESNGMLTVTPYFGRLPYTYTWSHDPELNSPVAENLAAGDYTVTVTDADNSTASTTGTVTQPSQIIINGVITHVSCYNGNDGALTINIDGGKGPYVTHWTSPDGSGIDPSAMNQTGLTPGTYTLTVTDANGCQATGIYAVTQPDKINYAGSAVTNIITPPGGNGSVDLNPGGGTTPYYFEWTGPGGFSASTEDIGDLADAGVYTLSLTDANNCTSDTAFTVSDEDAYFALISAKTDVRCYGETNGSAIVRVINGTKPYQYQWSDGVTLIDSVRTGMVAGNYVVTVTDAASRVTQAGVEIYQPSLALSPLLNVTDLHCYDDNSGVIDLVVSGGTLPYSFIWSNGYTGEDLVNVAAGNYSVTITDANGCQVLGAEEVSQPARLGLNIAVPSPILCYGDRNAIATANATGGVPSYSYLWDDPGTQTTQSAFGLRAGTYHVRVTDQNNCSTIGEVAIIQPNQLSVTAEVNDPTCSGLSTGSIIPTPAGGTPPGYDYIWSNGVYERFNTNIPAGTYTLTLSDNNNCTVVETFELTDPVPLSVDDAVITGLTCADVNSGMVDITVSGGALPYSFAWSNGQTGEDLENVLANTYTVTITDNNDCEFVEDYEVTGPEAIEIIISVEGEILCHGDQTGTLIAEATGGTPDYEFSWSNGVSGASNPDIPSGTYTVTVTDANDCTVDSTYILEEPDALAVTAAEITDVLCHGLSTGIIDLTISGGTAPYTYEWSNGHTGEDLENIAAAVYTFTVTDDNDCELSDSYQVHEPHTIDITEQVAAGNTITVTATGGTPPLVYTITGGTPQPAGIFTELANGAYTVEITDANECGPVESDEFVINVIGVEQYNPGGLSIYPNPSTGKFNLVFSPGREKTRIEVLSITGNVVYRQEFTTTSGMIDTVIDMSALPKGLYMLRINDNVIRDKLIIY